MNVNSIYLLILSSMFWCSSVYGSAQIVGVYENCRFSNVTVFVADADVPGNVSVEAEMAAAKSGTFDGASQAAKQVLDSYGISEVAIERRGFTGCQKKSSGKFIQALGHYCEGKLVRAEILIDDKVYATRTDETSTFDDFVEHQRERLRKQGIHDVPKVTVQNDTNCAPPRSP